MGYANMIGKYQLSRTIGEGSFAKVKLAINTETGKKVAIKVINKCMVIENNLIHQVQREIRTMKLLSHPNIVKIYEVIGTKTKIYIAMEYVSGGQLSDKMSYTNRMDEEEARKHFQQLIDAVDYCHCRGVYHRDIKPENLLLDNKGNLKVSDFGLSALRKPGDLLSTACGSPSYIAPELLRNKGYEGAAADIWSCGVILFELLAGHLPFNDQNLMQLYRKIMRAEYSFPEWLTESQKTLISGMLEPIRIKRLTIPEITESQWFQTNYEPAVRIAGEDINLDDINATFKIEKEQDTEAKRTSNPSFVNAFQLIAMSQDLDLSGLFEEQEKEKGRMMLGSKLTRNETIKKIEAAAKDVSLAVERMNNCKLKIHPTNKIIRSSRSCFNLAAEVIQVAPRHCVIEVSHSAGELGLYREFCRSLSSMLTERSDISSVTQTHKDVNVSSKSTDKTERFSYTDNKNKKEIRGYTSS